MDIIEEAAEALEELTMRGIPVQQGWYDGSIRKLHVTLWRLSDSPGSHSDDECDTESGTVQVNIWSDRDQHKLAQEIKRRMKEHGFVYTEGNDQAEPDTGIFTNAMRFFMMKETEETEE